MLADPDLNMYLCVIQYPFVGGARLREAPDLIPKWCGYFPTEKQEMFMRVARRGDIGVFMFDKTAQYPNAFIPDHGRPHVGKRIHRSHKRPRFSHQRDGRNDLSIPMRTSKAWG